MPARMTNPVMVVPGGLEAMLGLSAATDNVYLPPETRDLVRLLMVAAWREASCCTEPDRAALALAECITRLSDPLGPAADWS